MICFIKYVETNHMLRCKSNIHRSLWIKKYLQISKCMLPMKSHVLKNVINTSVLYFKIYTSSQHHSRTFMIDKKRVPRKTFQHRLNASFPTFFYFLMSRCFCHHCYLVLASQWLAYVVNKYLRINKLNCNLTAVK